MQQITLVQITTQTLMKVQTYYFKTEATKLEHRQITNKLKNKILAPKMIHFDRHLVA